MYTLAETMKIIFGLELEGEGRFFCMEIDHDRALLSNRTQGMASCYSFNLITAGSMTLHYNGSVLTLNVDDLYTYAPGQPVTMLSASDDLHYYVLLAEESLTLESSAVRNIVRAAYSLVNMIKEYKSEYSTDSPNNIFFTTSSLRDYHYTKQKNNAYYHIQAINLPFQNIEFYYLNKELEK